MKLPNIEQSNTHINKSKKAKSLIKQKYKIIPETNNESSIYKVDSLLNKMKEINEIRIYLKEGFIKNEIDDIFIKDVEKEYAEQFLLKMKMFPTKKMINKVLKICPLKNCDFELNNEFTYVNNIEKYLKVMHIYPVFDRKESNFKTIQNISSFKKRENTVSNEKSKNFQTLTSTGNHSLLDRLKTIKDKIENNQRTINKEKNKYNYLSIETSPKIKNFFGTEENFKNRNRVNNFKRRNQSINTNTGLLYNRETIDDMLAKDRENVANIQLFTNKKSLMKIDLSPENIKEKYISSESNWSNQTIENRGKLSRISKSILTYKNVLNNEKYFFNLKDLDNLNREIMEEVNDPINLQIELIIKDVNFILDNFPLDAFVQVKNENLNINLQKDFINKITVNSNEELLKIFKILGSNDSCRIIGLCSNLLYWIIFGGNSHIQIDSNTKECLFLKIIKEWENIGSKFDNIKLFYKVYTPLFIIICRIEIENIFIAKFINLFKKEKNKNEILKRANAIISEIFDKHGYMNTFNLLCGNQTEFNKKFHPNYLPRYKNKLYATSNFVDILFRNENKNIRTDSFEEVKEKKDFIMKQKADYFNFYLNKMNNILKKRNLEPIFKIRKIDSYNCNIDKKQKTLFNSKEIGINKFENNENMKITDYIEKTRQEYIKSFSQIKKRFSSNNNNNI